MITLPFWRNFILQIQHFGGQQSNFSVRVLFPSFPSLIPTVVGRYVLLLTGLKANEGINILYL